MGGLIFYKIANFDKDLNQKTNPNIVITAKFSSLVIKKYILLEHIFYILSLARLAHMQKQANSGM